MAENSFAELLRLIIKKEGITTIINYASDLLSAALVIVDNSPQLNFYAFSTNHIPRDPYWAEAFQRGECTERLHESVFDSNFVITMPGKAQNGYSINPDNQTLKYWCYFPVSSTSQHRMTMIALPDIDYFSEKQIDLLQSFIKMLTLTHMDALQPSHIASHPDQQDFHSAIRGIPTSITPLETSSLGFLENNISPVYSKTLSWENVQIIVLQSSPTDRTLSMWQIIINAINDIVKNQSTTLLDGRIISLTALLCENQLDSLQIIAAKYDLHIGISWPFSSRADAPTHYKQALYAINTALQIENSASNPDSKHTRIHSYDQFYHYNLILDNPIVADWNEFRPETLKILEAYDQTHNTNLYLTFKEYLMQNQRATPTAKKLNLHKSTVQHRMETIENLLGNIDLSSQTISSLLIAYAIDSIVY